MNGEMLPVTPCFSRVRLTLFQSINQSIMYCYSYFSTQDHSLGNNQCLVMSSSSSSYCRVHICELSISHLPTKGQAKGDISNLGSLISLTSSASLDKEKEEQDNWFGDIKSSSTMKYSLSAFILLSILVGAFAQTGPQIASYFREHLSPTSTLYIPSQVNYTLLTTQRWNAFSEPTYIVSVKPATDLDVQKIVRFLLHSRRSPFPQS